jgi:hypothetical protein
MPTVKLPNGQTAAFPDGMSPDDIQKAIESDPNSGAHIPTDGTLSAAPAPSWGSDLENDLREGGNRTVVGRFLGKMQGRGDQGYTGLQSGVSQGAADIAGSPELGAAHMISSAQQIPSHPVSGTLGVVSGALQAATLPSMFAVGPAAEAASAAVPSRSAAADVLNSVLQQSGHQPVNLNNASDALLRVQELAQRGTSMPQAAGKLLRRTTEPNSPPLTLEEARDFYTNLSRLSSNESQRLSPTMQGAVRSLRGSFNQDIGDAAEASSPGSGQDYMNAVREYARATQMGKTGVSAAKWLTGAAGAGLAGKIAIHYLDKK